MKGPDLIQPDGTVAPCFNTSDIRYFVAIPKNKNQVPKDTLQVCKRCQ